MSNRREDTGSVKKFVASLQKDFKTMNNTTLNRSPARDRSGLAKIDARIYADVQSRGLSSRIVKYHDIISHQNFSMKNLTSENRQIPAARVAKPQLPFKLASKQKVSMTHIAPPSKSAFCGNTLSGLLRSSSVITLQHSDDGENRPIIHPPGTEKELQPTRSVLEVLKEISRKRINNEDADGTDTSKKYCNRIDGDLINGYAQQDYRNVLLQAPQTYKRQREIPAEYSFNSSRIDQNTSISKFPQNRNETSSPSSPSSPEQQAKRRQTNYNNDITSSLSSSKNSNKRKLLDIEGDKQQEKQLRYQSEIRLPELSNALKYIAKTPVTPLPNTPQISQGISSKEMPFLPANVQKSVSTPIEESGAKHVAARPEPKTPKVTLFNINYKPSSEAPIEDKSVGFDDNEYAGIQFVKPKKATVNNGFSHLLMERTRKSKLALMLSGLRGELYLGDEDPQENPIEVPEKQVEEMQVYPNIEPSKVNSTNNSKITHTTSGSTTTTTSPNVSITTTFVNTTLSANPKTSIATSETNVVDSCTTTNNDFLMPTVKPTTTTTSSPTKITSPLTGIKLIPQTTATTTAATTSTQSTIAPIAPGPTFSFGISTTAPTMLTTQTLVSSKASPIALPSGQKATISNNTTPFTMFAPTQTPSSVSTTNKLSLPTFGLATGQETSTAFSQTPATTVQNPTTSSTTFSFGIVPTSAPTSSITAITTTQPITAPVSTTLPVFSFGNSASLSATNVTTPTTVTTVNPEIAKTIATTVAPFSFGGVSGGAISFGANIPTTNTTAVSNTATEASKTFSFTSTKTSTAPSNGFSFGGITKTENKTIANTNLLANSNTVTPVKFGSSSTTAGLQQQQNVAIAQPTSNNSFIFGNKPADPASQEKTTSPAVNSTTFGSLVTNNQEKPFSFGAPNSTVAESSKPATNIFNIPNNSAKPSFSFGSSTANTSVPTTTASGTNSFSLTNNNNQSNLFNFGGSNTSAKPSSEASKPNNTFSFGSNTQNKPFSFGSTNVEAPKPGFNFGSTSQNNTASTEASKANNAFNFAPNNAFSFGGSANKPNTTEPSSTVNKTVTPNNAPTNLFSFGAEKSPLTQNSTFGTAPGNGGQSNVFNFSGSNNTNLTSKNDAPKPVNSTFNTFTQGNTFSFGGAIKTTTTPATSLPKPTTFGKINSNTAAPSNTLVFAGTSNNNPNPAASNGGNLFAMPSNVNTNPPPTPFGGIANTTGTTSTVNIFSASPQTNSSDRPIRRATRRLHKS